MEYIGIGVVIAVAIAAGIIIYTKFNKREDIPLGDLVSAPSAVISGKDELMEIHHENELIIQMEMLPAEAIDDDTKLVEITDSKVLAHVNNLVPGLAQAGNAVNNAAQAVQAANKESVQEKMELTNDLYRAVEQEEFILHYQPQVHIESGRIIGMEALIRWQHPERGLISLGVFIPLAEQTGLIHKMGEWVLKTACAQNKKWQGKGFDPVVMAVNLSVEQFRGKRLIETIKKSLEESKLDPKFLELEITESVAIKEPSYIVKMLQDMKKLGVSIAIDDFGTEYSSLSRLKELPIDRLKLAMEFVRGIDNGEKDEAISMAIIYLAKRLGMKVIAEGVEKETQMNFLKARVCDEVQGFYFYHPMPADEVEKIMIPKL